MAYPTPFRERLALTTTYADVLTVPSGKYAEFTMIQVANVDGVNSVDASVQWLTPAAVATPLILNGTVAAKDAISPMAGMLILMTGDKLQAKALVVSDAVITVCGNYLDNP